MRKDPVTPEVADHVFRRDIGCVVGKLGVNVGPCRGRYGEVAAWSGPWVPTDLTLAHVRDRGLGGRLGRRPPSTARHLVVACYGHHLAVPVVDRPTVRDVLDDYLSRMEGPEPETSRPWERIRRIRGRDDGA